MSQLLIFGTIDAVDCRNRFTGPTDLPHVLRCRNNCRAHVATGRIIGVTLVQNTSLSTFRGALLATAATIVATLTPVSGYAQTTTAADDATDAKEIIVIGTRRTDRSSTDSASPIDVIGAAELNAQPASDLLDVVRNIVPSFFVPQNTISDASTFVRAPSLRGLGADQILVMINGKRYNRSALVQVYTGGETALSYGSQGADISAIPAIAVGNLQILRDGATAQYGSDAIGGVINYGIRENTGLELQARYGETFEGDGESYQLAGNFGFKVGERGFVNLSAEYFNDGETSRGAQRPIALQFAAANPTLASKLPNAPGPVQNWGSSPSDGYKLFLNSAVDVSDNSKVYLTVNVAHKESNQSFNYRSPVSATTPFVVNNGSGTPGTASPSRNSAFTPIFLTPCPAGNATCPAGGFVQDANTYNFTSVYPAGFTPRFLGVVDQYYGTLGFKGKADSGLTYDISATAARNSLDLSMNSSLNASFGPQSQTAFRFGELIQREVVLNADFTYPLEAGFASPITLSGGLEYRREQYEATPGELQSYAAGPFAQQRLYTETAPGSGVYTCASPLVLVNGVLTCPVGASKSPGASGYGGTNPAAAGKFSQSNYSIYVGAETDITEALSVGIAARGERYNTFGNAYVGKLNAIYRISDALSIRGTVGTGFHAPSPGQSNVQILTTTFVNGDQVQVGTYPVNSVPAQFFGARQLKPERATNFGAGFIVKPNSALTFTVDGYIIKVRDRIGITRDFSITAADVAAQPALLAVGVGGVVNYFTNGFNVTTEGVDVVGNYRTSLADSPLNFTLAYNYNKSRVTKFNPDVISAAQRINISNLAPKHRANFSVNWQIGDFTLNARENFYSSWRTEIDYPGQVFKSKFTTDLDVSYTLAEHYTLTLGANNLFDTYPDRIAGSSTNPVFAVTNSLGDGQVYPRTGGPFGINGGFYYARLRVKY